MKKRKIIRVQDVMIREVDIVNRRDTVREALASMKHFAARTMIVDKRDENDEYGIVDFGSIAREVLAKDRSPDRVNIYEIMTKPTLNASPNMDIRYCARMFERFSIHRAPVVKDGTVIGIISYEQMLQQWLNPAPAAQSEPTKDEADKEHAQPQDYDKGEPEAKE